MTVRIRVSRPFFPSHTKLRSVLTRASTSGMFAFMDMALSSFSSWLFSRRYLFLQTPKRQKIPAKTSPVTQLSDRLDLGASPTVCERHCVLTEDKQRHDVTRVEKSGSLTRGDH